MNKEKIITTTIAFVKKELKNAEGGHDWFHIARVFKNSILISKDEKVDVFVVSLAALLHDIADPKFYNGDETVGPRVASEFLTNQNVSKEIMKHVVNIIQHISYKNSFDKASEKFSSTELKVVQDADRLDALGAIALRVALIMAALKTECCTIQK